jgi:hypothetical protein
MVRAAVSGAIDYSRADPTDVKWRIKHRLLLDEVRRQEDQKMLESVHRHWCAYLSHGGLTEESFAGVKKTAGETLTALQTELFPWLEAQPAETEKQASGVENSKIDAETQNLIERFKVWRGGRNAGE